MTMKVQGKRAKPALKILKNVLRYNYHLKRIVMHMKRNAIFELIRWNDSADRKPMVLKGARQVGKT